MKEILENCKTIHLDTHLNVEKTFFDENYGFRHIPVLFQNAYNLEGNRIVTTGENKESPSYFNCWYDQYFLNGAPEKKIFNFESNNLSEFRKNNWDLSSWHFVSEGEVTWIVYPPSILEYLQLIVPEASEESGLIIDVLKLSNLMNIRPLKVVQRKGQVLFLPPFYAYAIAKEGIVNMVSQTILTEYNHDNLYAYFRNTDRKNIIKRIILEGFKSIKHLSKYETPAQRSSHLPAI
jgi:hypothetical protein